jgi:hypothetical protein
MKTIAQKLLTIKKKREGDAEQKWTMYQGRGGEGGGGRKCILAGNPPSTQAIKLNTVYFSTGEGEDGNFDSPLKLGCVKFNGLS